MAAMIIIMKISAQWKHNESQWNDGENNKAIMKEMAQWNCNNVGRNISKKIMAAAMVMKIMINKMAIVKERMIMA